MADKWEIIEKLGAGGQGDVFLVRSAEAATLRWDTVSSLVALVRNQMPPLAPPEARRDGNTIQAWGMKALPDLLRTLVVDDPSTLGALKEFRIPETEPDRTEALHRLGQEIDALQKHQHPAILRLLDADFDARKVVTEYHPLKTLEQAPDLFRGDVGGALSALLPVVEAVAQLHKAGVVHRDIKPGNIFRAADGRLVLGDFGLVFYADAEGSRFTQTYEKVGTHVWMPPWVHTGRRLETVPPTFDVFALGKVLWCMVAGERMLPLWYWDRDGRDLGARFPRQPEMAIVNGILRASVVEHEKDCYESAEMMFGAIHEALLAVRRGGVTLRDGETFPCRVCARGICKPSHTTELGDVFKLLALDPEINASHPKSLMDGALPVRVYRCDSCHNLVFFHFPPNKPLPRGWLPAEEE